MNNKHSLALIFLVVATISLIGLIFVSEFSSITGEVYRPRNNRCCIQKENGLYSILGPAKQCRNFEIDYGLIPSPECAKKSAEYRKKLNQPKPVPPPKPVQAVSPTPIGPPKPIIQPIPPKPKCIPECFSNNCGGENDGCGGKCKIRAVGELCSGGFCDGKGACRKSICKDTDGGDNPSVTGEVSGFDKFNKPFSFKDSCKDVLVFNKPEKAVQEYYCAPELAGSLYGSTYVFSTRNCGSGKTCKDGACVPAQYQVDPNLIVSCVDSDAKVGYEKEIYTPGYVELKYGDGKISYLPDKVDNGKIYEHMCRDGNRLTGGPYYCPHDHEASPNAGNANVGGKTIVMAACVRLFQSCQDNDIANDPMTAGYLKLILGKKTNFWGDKIEGSMISESYCAAPNISGYHNSKKVSCPQGTKPTAIELTVEGTKFWSSKCK